MKRKPFHRHENQKGFIAIALVTLIMVSLLIGISISEWVSIQRRGGMQMRLGNKQHTLAMLAVQETLLAILDGRVDRNFTAPHPDYNFSIEGSSSTMTVSISCFQYPPP